MSRIGNGVVSVPWDAETAGSMRSTANPGSAGRASGARRTRLRRVTVALLLGWLAGAGLESRAETMVEAIRRGDAAGVRRMVLQGDGPRARDEWGNTPLHLAAMMGDVESVRALLVAGADPNATNHAGVTPLLRAAADPEKVALLLRHGARATVASAMGHTPLHLAARSPSSTESVRLLLKHGAAADARSLFGATPLMAAAAASNLDAARLLVEAGADVNAVPMPEAPGPGVDPIFGGLRTPLMWAALRGDRRMAEYLLERGADVNLVTGFGTALSQTGWMGNTEMARWLLDRGARVETTEPISGYTTLHWAASVENGRSALVELLLKHGANPNAEGGQPVDAFMGRTRTPLALARERGETEVTAALAAAGAKPETVPALERAAGSRQALVHYTEDAVRTAVAAAVAPLQRTAVESQRAFVRHGSKQDCASCHQQFLPMAAVGWSELGRVKADAGSKARQIETVQRIHRQSELDAQPLFHPEPTHTYGYALLGLDAVGAVIADVSDPMVHHLASIQHLDGHWDVNLFRPPMQSSPVTATAFGVYALKRYGWEARGKEFSDRVRRGAKWLSDRKVELHEDRTYQLLGLSWAGSSPTRLRRLADALAATQREDGGWSQLPGLASDAYATGQALYALRVAGGYPGDHPVVRRAMGFLLQTQLADGTWHVRRRAFPFQPTMESGFPHGRDSWISATATSWAVMGLSATLGRSGENVPARGAEEETSLIPVKDVRRSAAGVATDVKASAVTEGMVDFEREIRPLLERSCVPCHSGERPRGGYRMTTRESLLAGGGSGAVAVVAGDSSRSPLLSIIAGAVPDLEMPPAAKRDVFPGLTAEETARMKTWIDGGAAWPAGVELRPVR